MSKNLDDEVSVRFSEQGDLEITTPGHKKNQGRKASEQLPIYIEPSSGKEPTDIEARAIAALKAAYDDHFSWGFKIGGGLEEQGFIGLSVEKSFYVDDVAPGGKSLGYWSGPLSGVYLVTDKGDEQKLNDLVLYSLKIDNDAFERFWKDPEATGQFHLEFKAEPMDGENKETLTLMQAMVWAAVSDLRDEAEKNGTEPDEELIDTLVWSYYKMPKKSGSDPDAAHIKTSTIQKASFTTDKVNGVIWNRFATLPSGQMALGFNEDGSGAFDIDLASYKDKQQEIQRIATYSIDFDNLGDDVSITRHLEPYDKRVYEALSSLWNEITEQTGQDTFSLVDVYHAMGNTSRPGKTYREKINASITKLAGAHVTIDNYDEAAAYHSYRRFQYDASLLPMERVTGYVDGQLTNGLIHLFREPPLFTFARERKQFTTVPMKVLQTPLSKTQKNLIVEDYLREQIAWMKHKKSKRSNEITFESIFRETGASKKRDRDRDIDRAKAILDHYAKCDWIKRYKIEEDRFSIIY